MKSTMIPVTRRWLGKPMAALFGIAGWMWMSCSSPSSAPRTVDSVMDGVVTRLYAELDEQQLDAIDDAFMAQFLTGDEKETLATAYWQFEVNVPVVVSLMRDTAQRHVPFWLESGGFTKTDLVVKNALSTYEVWQASFPSGKVGLGINGFDRHRPVYWIAVAPQQVGDQLTITPRFPQDQYIGILDTGAFTYHDWDGLVLDDVPESLRGQALLTTIRGRAREAHVIGAFRTTEFPSSAAPDQVTLTLPADPETGMTVQWRTAPTISHAWIKYWTADGTDTLTAQADHAILEDRQLRNDRYTSRFLAQLENLSPGTRYHYVVGHDGAASDTLAFTTASQDGPFSFLWAGDVHNDPKSGELLRAASGRFPESAFCILAGDLVNTGLYRNDWDGLFGYTDKAFGGMPLMAVPGNHDSQDGLGASMYRALLQYPHNGPAGLEPGLTYAFNYRNALFLMIDAVSFPAADQAQWIAEQLANTDAVWKFVVFHFPPYTDQEPYRDIEDAWVPLFDEYGVDVVMNGHFHYYLRTEPMRGGRPAGFGKHGTTYIMSIGTRNKNENGAPEAHAAKRVDQGYLYQHVHVDGTRLLHTTLDAAGNVLDSFELQKRPNRQRHTAN